LPYKKLSAWRKQLLKRGFTVAKVQEMLRSGRRELYVHPEKGHTNMDIGQETTIYVKALSNGEWFGGWAPMRVRLEWLRPDGQAAHRAGGGLPGVGGGLCGMGFTGC